MINLKLLSDLMGIAPRCVCEVGVNEPERCSVAEFIRVGISARLVEPLPWCAKNLRQAFRGALVIEGCIADQIGTMKLYDRGEGSWLVDLPSSPDIANNQVTIDPEFIREVNCFTMNEIDPGTIDVLAVDTEGAEWWCIKHLVSRPRIIRIETHLEGRPYVNPFLREIEAWMRENGYCLLCRDISDSVYVR